MGAAVAQEANVDSVGRVFVEVKAADEATSGRLKAEQETEKQATKIKVKKEANVEAKAKHKAQAVAEVEPVAEAIVGETLSSALRDARTSEPKWRGAIYARQAALEKLPQARAGLLPDISIAITRKRSDTYYQTVNTRIPVKDIQSTFFEGSFQVKLTQPLFNWDKLVLYRQADFDVLAAEKQYAQDNQDFLLRVAKVYLDLASAIEMHLAATEQVATLSEQYRLTLKSYQVGIGNITELYESEARFELSKGEEASYKRQMELCRKRFRSIVGRADYGPALVMNNIQLSPPLPNDEHLWNSNAMANSPEILRKQAVLEKARLEIARRRAGYLPTVDGVVSRSRSYSEHLSYALNGYIENKLYVGVEVAIPLFSGLSVVSKVREAESNKDQAAQDMEYSRRSVSDDTAEAFGFVTNGLDELGQYQKSLEGSRKSEKANRLGYRVGVKSNIDVLNSQQQVFTDTRRVVKAKYDVIYYSLKLKALVGELDEAEFLEIDHLFEKALPPSQDRND